MSDDRDKAWRVFLRADLPKSGTLFDLFYAGWQAANAPENRYFQPTTGAECPHCKRVVGTFSGCAVGGCPCGEDM
ncbi:MAG TPA: hypothetical protein VND94_00905 [Terriglobia bacterium]|nr:hypothetical protein [Terriglobia bacterium]